MTLLKVQVDALTVGGACIAHALDSDYSKKIFVRDTIPGEVALVELTEEKNNYAHARLHEICTTSAKRVIPPCPIFAQCGGCDLQHLDIAAQRQAKLVMVQDMLRMQGGIVPLAGIELIGADLPAFNYRQRISLHLSPTGDLGFYRSTSEDIVPLQSCLIAQPAINAILPLLQKIAPLICKDISAVVLEAFEGRCVIILKQREIGRNEVSTQGRELSELITELSQHTKDLRKNVRAIELHHHGSYVTDISRNGDEKRDSAGHFSQVNPYANAALIELIQREIHDCNVTDLFAGYGNLSLPLLERGCNVEAVEVDKALVRYGKQLASTLPRGKHIRFFEMPCEQFVSSKQLQSTVILDPPRAGIKNLIPGIICSKAQRLLYVSCSLPSLARDLKQLSFNAFTVVKVFVLDMFPQTHHVETIALIER